MQPGLRHELWVIGTLVAGTLIAGAVFGYPLWFLVFGLGVYLAVAVRNLIRLHGWLLSKKQQPLPEARGLWGDVFNEIHLLEKETAQHRDRLRDMLTRFQEAASALPDGMVILTQQGEIVWANPSARSLLGISYPRDSGQRINNLVRHPEFNAYLEEGEFTESVELSAPLKPDNTLTVQIVPYGGNQRLLVCRNITHVIRLEEMRQNFVANASHELRSPITVLSGYLETLQDMDLSRTAEIKRALATMYNQARRMERLVSDLLALSKLETAAPQATPESIVDVPAMLASLKESAEMLSGEDRHQITLSAAPMLKLRGNEEQLRSVFSNLIDNAVRYTPPGGAIEIAWRNANNWAIFSVKDNGVGIAWQHIPHLTERFYRVDVDRSRESGGTGLGLAIVKHVLKRHDARLNIESVVGKGSTFACKFPPERVVTTTMGESLPKVGERS